LFTAGHAEQDSCRARRHEPILCLSRHCEYILSESQSADTDQQHTFFVVTLTSGLIYSIQPLIENPASIASVLATEMPRASTFFITLILTRFTGTVGNLIQPISLTLYFIRIGLSGGTPRSMFTSRYRLGRDLCPRHFLRSYRYRLHGHFARHQRFRRHVFLAIGLDLQVPLDMGVGSTEINGYRWTILSKGYSSSFCRDVHSRGLSMCLVLLGEERGGKGFGNPSGGTHDCLDRYHCESLLV
jgi:hypothetical protein